MTFDSVGGISIPEWSSEFLSGVIEVRCDGGVKIRTSATIQDSDGSRGTIIAKPASPLPAGSVCQVHLMDERLSISNGSGTGGRFLVGGNPRVRSVLFFMRPGQEMLSLIFSEAIDRSTLASAVEVLDVGGKWTVLAKEESGNATGAGWSLPSGLTYAAVLVRTTVTSLDGRGLYPASFDLAASGPDFRVDSTSPGAKVADDVGTWRWEPKCRAELP